MRILFISPYPPSRIRVRSYGFVTHLAHQHDIEVLALCADDREETDMQALRSQGLLATAIREKRLSCYLRGIRSLVSPMPVQVAYGASPAMRTAIASRLASGKFDLVHVEFIRSLGALPTSIPVPALWDAVDCVSRLYEQGARARATPLMRLVGRSEAKRARAYEHEQLQRFRHVLVTAERDRQALLAGISDGHDAAGQTRAEITVLPHGIDTTYFQRYDGPRQPETLIFSGRMSFHANRAGVRNLVERILPLVWKQRPNVRLVLAGCDPPSAIRRLAIDPRIEVSGYVNDLRPLIAQACIAVCPLPYAVGIQNKVLEAMALGTPVIASSCAASGLPLVAGRDLLVADAPDVFATEIVRLLDDQTLWNKLAEQGRTYITTHHDWNIVLQRLTAIYKQITK